MPDFAAALQVHVGHEALGRTDVPDEILDALEQAEPVANLDVGGRDIRERLATTILILFRPRLEPGVDGVGRAARSRGR